MDRRKFLKGAAALFCAPAIVKAESIMRINPDLYVPEGIISGFPQSKGGKPLGVIDVYVGEFNTFKMIPNKTLEEHAEIDRALFVNEQHLKKSLRDILYG